MAHKTKINGTNYDVSGGKTLIGGTAYKITGGKTLVGGTAYEVGFGPKVLTVRVTGNGYVSYTYKPASITYNTGTYNKTVYSEDEVNGSIEVTSGAVISCRVCASGTAQTGKVILNGEVVASIQGANTPFLLKSVDYDYTATKNAIINLAYESVVSGETTPYYVGTITITEE